MRLRCTERTNSSTPGTATTLCRHVASDRLPSGQDFRPVAQVQAGFDEVLDRHGARARREHRVLAGGWYRYLVLELASGRFALLLQDENDPASFNIHLQSIRRISFHRADFDAVCGYINVPSERIVVFTGQVKWK